jgi:uncharacterized protein YdiU (UPF0061 family)
MAAKKNTDKKNKIKSDSSQKEAQNFKSTDLLDKLKTHELFSKVPEMCIPYSVRANEKGEVFYINEDLSKEMGLLDKDSSIKALNKLKAEVLEAFNLQIINDYDRLNHTSVSSKNVKPYFCFATRYLQLQHKNNQGKTSGDGRAIWNGTISNKGKTWDVSSRGTGVTSLAPGVVEAGIPLKTGNTEYGYSCGLSDLKEVYTSIVMSERFHKMGFATERILAGIDIGGGLGICVRASDNLIRPAHLFRYLKLSDHHGAKSLLTHVIDRDFKNKKIDFNSEDSGAFDKYLNYFTDNFSTLCAKSKHSEVFVWLDWDGDNILIDGGIIDYGSIRHFGAHHNKYRHKDTDRFSTNLDEQVKKAKLTVQFFAQLTDFVKTENKKPMDDFKNKKVVTNFEQEVYKKEIAYFLQDLGLTRNKVKETLSWHLKDATRVYESFMKLKLKKASKSLPCDDGLNTWPLFNANHLLADLKKIKFEEDLEKYKTEFTSFTHNKGFKSKEVFEFIDLVSALEDKLNFKFNYSGDAKNRLTTAAILHLVDLIADEKTPRKIQKKIDSCVNFGDESQAGWIAEIKDLYRDEL